jgi:hypothetical protein
MNVRKTISAVAAVLAFGGIAAGCGSAAQSVTGQKAPVTSQAPKSHADQVRSDLLAWKAAGGMSAMEKVVNDLQGMDDPSAMTAQQIAQVNADIDAAKAKPFPASADPGAYYTAFLSHMETALTSLQNNDPISAMVEAEGALTTMQHLSDEIHQLPQGILS